MVTPQQHHQYYMHLKCDRSAGQSKFMIVEDGIEIVREFTKDDDLSIEYLNLQTSKLCSKLSRTRKFIDRQCEWLFH